ncbi:MAG: hypothetical protein EXS64_02395 [Candidatus Latescibacteria bacterium]|nr:hypothetical protein [Candidatus Latescibacterota bacterium]
MNRSDGISITHAPDRVEVGRVFRIVLEVPKDQTPVNVSAPASVQVVDRTAPERAGETIFYFRAQGVERGARFRFEGKSAGAEAVVDCLDRAGILERREQGEVRLPRRWPIWETVDELKASRTIWRREDLERALAWGSRNAAEVRKVREEAEAWVAKGDGALWALLPKAEVPRWHFVNLHVGCPVHGEAIFKHSGYYPWKSDVEGMPYRVQCPVGGEWYPSNDIAADDFTSGDYPDDGYGCVKDGVKWAFSAVHQNVRGYHFNGGIRTLSEAFVRTGDKAMLHKVRVMLLRMADEWAYLSGKIEDRFLYGGDQLHYVEQKPRWPMRVTKVADLNRSGLINYCISLAGDFVTYATAYDLAWEGMDDDRELLALARERLGLRSGEEVRRYIEDHVFRVGAQTAIDGGAHSNLPYPQMGLTSLILAMNYRAGVRLADWLWNGGGQMRYWVPNFFYRDGSAYESTGGYNGMHVDATPPIARGLARLKALRPEVYGEAEIGTFEADPKAKLLYTHLSKLICIGRMYPQVGDGGYQPRAGNPPLERMYSMTQDARTHEYAFETYGDPLFARALGAGKGYEPGPESRVTREAVEEAIRRAGPETALESQTFDGYGIAVLRSGREDAARALWLRYGHARGHRQDDMLDIGLFAHRRNFMSQLGYPFSWAMHGVWDANWLTHYRVKVRGIEKGTIYRGALRSLAVTPGFQAARADGEAFRDLGKGEAGYAVYRDQPYSRWVALIDVDERDFYVLDVHRVRGGDEHWWSFHGPHGEAVVEGLRDVEAWPDGTPAGREVGYGEVEKLGDASLHSLTYLYNCRRGEVAGPWGATWRLSGDANLELRMRQLAQDGEVIAGDGKPPISSKEDPPYRLTWTLAHRKGAAPLSSQFITLIEAGEHPVVRKVERLRVKGTGTFEPVAVRAETARGTDLIVSASEAGSVTPESGDWAFDGEYGFARIGASGVEQVSVTGGRHFIVEGIGIAETTGAFTAKVIGGDFRSREVILSAVPQPVEAVIGQYVRFDSENRSSMYRVLAAEKVAQGVRLTLDVDIRIGEGTADGFEDGVILSPVHFPLAGYRYDHGAYLRTVSGEVFVLDHIESDTVANIESGLRPQSRIVLAPVDGKVVPADRLRTAFEAGKAFVIYDVGVGDRATFTLTAWVRRTDGRALRHGSGQAWEGFVGTGTVLSVGRGVSGMARVTRGTREWTLPILQDGSGLSLVDLGEAGIGIGPIQMILRVR